MRHLRWLILLLTVICLPGCRGCERTVREPEGHPPEEGVVVVDPGPKGPEPGPIGGPPPDPWSPGTFERDVEIVAVHASDPYFRIDASCADDGDWLTVDQSFGCVMTGPISAEVKRIVNQWTVYRVTDRRAGIARTYFVSDPPRPPAEGCEGCSEWPAGFTRQDLPAPNAGSVESGMSLSVYGLRFDWQVVPSRVGEEPEWRDDPIVRGNPRPMQVDGKTVAVTLFRSDLERLAATSHGSFAIIARVTQADWPDPAPDPELQRTLRSRPISMEQIRQQLEVLNGDELPEDPGVTKRDRTTKPGGGERKPAKGGARGDASGPPLQRRGSVTRHVVRRVEPVSDAAPGQSRREPPEASDLASLVRRSLELPDNAGFRDWVEAGTVGHALRSTRPDVESIEAAWQRPDGSRLAAALPLDVARGRAIQRHFGIPDHALPAAYLGGEDVLEVLENLTKPLVRLHGVRITDDSIDVDHEWVVAESIPVVAPSAGAVLRSDGVPASGRRASRRVVESLARFVQTAVPYVPIGSKAGTPEPDGAWRGGLRTPAETLRGGGDCDSKSLLLASMIRSVDETIPVALVFCVADGVPHMLIAVGCEHGPRDQVVSVEGVDHVFIETTGEFPVGSLPEGVSQIDPRPVPPSADS